MNRNALIQELRAIGWKGKTLADAKTFIDDEGIDLRIAGGKSIDDVWGQKATLTLDEGENLNSLEVQGGASEEPADPEGAAMDEEDDDEEQLNARSARRQARKDKIKGYTQATAGIHLGGKAPSVLSARGIAAKRYDEARSQGRLIHVPGHGRKSPVFSSSDAAEHFGAKARLQFMGHKDYPQKANDMEIVGKAHVTTQNTLGGGLVADEYLPDLIELKEEHGVARRVCPISPMMGDVLRQPRLGSEFVVSAIGEGVQQSEQNTPTFNTIERVARKIGGYALVTNELLHDSAISVGDAIARSAARAMGEKEDEVFFKGDGSANSLGVTGFTNFLGSASLSTVTGSAFSAIDTIAEFEVLIGKIPNYADVDGQCYWVCHRAFFFGYMDPLLRAGGGNTQSDLGNKSGRQFLGYPVEFTQTMPSTDPGATTPFLLFGNFSQAAKMGEVDGSMKFETSEHIAFDSDETAFRVIERIAMAVHEGDSTTEAGPVIGMQLSS